MVEIGMSETTKDPVCGMMVNPATARHRHEHAGIPYYFCGAGCAAMFAADPEKLAKPPGIAPTPSLVVLERRPKQSKAEIRRKIRSVGWMWIGRPRSTPSSIRTNPIIFVAEVVALSLLRIRSVICVGMAPRC